MYSEFDSSTSATAFTLWLTGLPCAGKSTLAGQICLEFRNRGISVEVLDGDVLRESLCKGLGYSRQDRDENIARIGWACRTLNKHNVVAISATVSPYREARERLRESIPRFVEVYVKAPLRVCMERDVKGMYARAAAGKIAHFTGVDDPYEEPITPDLEVETDKFSVADCVRSMVARLDKMGLLDNYPKRSPGFRNFQHRVPGSANYHNRNS